MDIFACSGDVQFLLANGAAESSVPLAVSDTCGTLLFRQGQHLWHSAVQAVRGTRGHLSTIGCDAGRWLAQPIGVPKGGAGAFLHPSSPPAAQAHDWHRVFSHGASPGIAVCSRHLQAAGPSVFSVVASSAQGLAVVAVSRFMRIMACPVGRRLA